MSAASRMILWQLWRMTRFEIALVVLAQYGLLAVLLLVAHGTASPMFHYMMPVYFILMFITAVPAVIGMSSFAAGNNPKNPMPFPLQLDYAQPVRTFALVFLCMVYSCVKAATVYLVVAIPLRFGLGQPLPLLPFAYWLAVMVTVVQAAIWTPATAGGRAWGYIIGIGGVAVAFIDRLCSGPGGFDGLMESAEPLKGVFDHTPTGYLGLGLIAVGALAVAWASVERQRHGERFIPRLRIRSAAPARPRSRTAPRFSGPLQAQAWCEIRRALIPSLLIPLLAAMIIVLVSVLAVPFRNESDRDVMTTLWWVLVVGTFVATYGMIGHGSSALRFNGGAWRYSTFEATLPAGTGTLTLIKVGTVLAGGVVTAMLLAMGTAIAALPHLGQADWVGPFHEVVRELGSLRVASALLMLLSLVYLLVLWALSIPLLIFSFGEAATTRPRRSSIVFALCVADLCFAVLLLFLGHPMDLYVTIHAWGLAALVVCGTVWAVYGVLERGYINRRFFIVCLVLWALSVAIWGVLAVQFRFPVMMPRFGIEIALLFMPLLAVALPPLTLAANRHR